VTVTGCDVAEPPGPTQVKDKVTVAGIATASPMLLSGSLPINALVPLAVQLVAPDELQLTCTD